MATPLILKEKRILRLKSLLLDCYQKGYIFDFELDRVHKYLQQIRDYGFSYSPNTLKRFEIFEVVKTSRGQKKLHTQEIQLLLNKLLEHEYTMNTKDTKYELVNDYYKINTDEIKLVLLIKVPVNDQKKFNSIIIEEKNKTVQKVVYNLLSKIDFDNFNKEQETMIINKILKSTSLQKNCNVVR